MCVDHSCGGGWPPVTDKCRPCSRTPVYDSRAIVAWTARQTYPTLNRAWLHLMMPPLRLLVCVVRSTFLVCMLACLSPLPLTIWHACHHTALSVGIVAIRNDPPFRPDPQSVMHWSVTGDNLYSRLQKLL
jgi:hypothetical protein